MCGFDPVDINVVVSKNGASYGSDTHGAVFETEFVNYLGYEAVYDAVAAAGTIMCVSFGQQTRTACHNVFFFDYIVEVHGC